MRPFLFQEEILDIDHERRLGEDMDRIGIRRADGRRLVRPVDGQQGLVDARPRGSREAGRPRREVLDDGVVRDQEYGDTSYDVRKHDGQLPR